MSGEENKSTNENKCSSKDIIWGKDLGSHSGNSGIKLVNNDIYFYTFVSHGTILELAEYIRTATKNMMILGIENGIEPPPIKLHISSYGGGVFAGFAGMDLIKTNPVPIYTIVEGASASAATLLSVVGHKRLIHKSSYMLIHQLSSFIYGSFEEIKDEFQNLEKLMYNIKQVYVKHSKVKDLDEVLKHDFWFTSKECLDAGLVDEIIG